MKTDDTNNLGKNKGKSRFEEELDYVGNENLVATPYEVKCSC